jgi:hypothetical protein
MDNQAVPAVDIKAFTVQPLVLAGALRVNIVSITVALHVATLQCIQIAVTLLLDALVQGLIEVRLTAFQIPLEDLRQELVA